MRHGDVLGVQRKGNALLLRVNWTHYSGSTRSRGSRVRSSRSSAKTATRSTMARSPRRRAACRIDGVDRRCGCAGVVEAEPDRDQGTRGDVSGKRASDRRAASGSPGERLALRIRSVPMEVGHLQLVHPSASVQDHAEVRLFADRASQARSHGTYLVYRSVAAGKIVSGAE